ncbi:uncharacterized protein [Typha latifolia]|uniref:uncharacterized protein isoform X1 n=1 Tax=Typha latifolia TaxID=4733 RepID=UPI003C2EFF7C
MEALRKLERVQRTLSFMEARGLSSDHQDSDRLLAHFLLFLVQPCGGLSIEKRYFLITELLTKVTVESLEEAKLFIVDEDSPDIYPETSSTLNTQSKVDLKQSKVEDSPMIEFDAMERANSTLEDFCRSYFMFHGLDPSEPQCLFKFLPVLSFTESYIYQLDSLNESDLHITAEDAISPKRTSDRLSYMFNEVEDRSGANFLHETSGSDPFGPLISLLQSQGLLTSRIRTELKSGAEYWALEKKLCRALMSKIEISIEDVMRAIHLKSFDYRVLNLLLYQLRGHEVNELHMEFLSVSEFLVEVSDDLYDYEDDVINNCFNILRMFVSVHGASMASKMLAKCITEAEEKYETLSKTLDPDLSLNYWRRCEEATKEGGITTGHSYGTWNIPPVIVDEEVFRSQSTKPENTAMVDSSAYLQ